MWWFRVTVFFSEILSHSSNGETFTWSPATLVLWRMTMHHMLTSGNKQPCVTSEIPNIGVWGNKTVLNGHLQLILTFYAKHTNLYAYKIELLLVFWCWPRSSNINFDLLIKSCDISANDLNHERNMEKYGRQIKLAIVLWIFIEQHSNCFLTYSGFIQARLNKIQEVFKDKFILFKALLNNNQAR